MVVRFPRAKKRFESLVKTFYNSSSASARARCSPSESTKDEKTFLYLTTTIKDCRVMACFTRGLIIEKLAKRAARPMEDPFVFKMYFCACRNPCLDTDGQIFARVQGHAFCCKAGKAD